MFRTMCGGVIDIDIIAAANLEQSCLRQQRQILLELALISNLICAQFERRATPNVHVSNC